MASVQELLRLGLQDDLSGPLSKVISKVGVTDKAMTQARTTVMNLQKAITDSAFAFEETGQKYKDAQKKLAEYGATAEQQQFVLNKAAKMAGKYGLSVEKAAIVVEELAIETQDANQVLLFQSKAYDFVAKSSKRAEEAVADFVELTKGDVSSLREFGERGRKMADALESIEDPIKRARLAMAAHSKEQDRVNNRTLLGANVMDLFGEAQFGVAQAGPLVSGALMAGAAALAAVGAAAAAAGAAFVKFAKDSVGVALKEVEAFEIGISDVKNSWKELQKAFGTALIAGKQVDETGDKFHELARTIDEVTKAINDNADEIHNIALTVAEVATAVALTTTAIGANILTYFAGAWDLVKSLIAGGAKVLLETVSKLSSNILQVGVQLGVVDAKTANAFEKSRREMSKTASENIGFQMARGIQKYKEELQDAIKSAGAFVTAAKAARDVDRKDFRKKKKTGAKAAEEDLPGDDDIDFGANMAFTVAEELQIEYMKVQRAAREASGALMSPMLQESLQQTLATVSALPAQIQATKEKHESFMYNAQQAVPNYVNAWAEAFDIIGAAAKQSMGVVSGAIADVSKALINGKNAGSAFGKALLGGFGNTLQQMGEGYVQLGALMALTGDPVGLAVAAGGGILTAIGAGMSAGAAKLGGGGSRGSRAARSGGGGGSLSAPSAAVAGGGFAQNQAINLAVQLNIADQSFDDAVESSVQRNAISNR